MSNNKEKENTTKNATAKIVAGVVAGAAAGAIAGILTAPDSGKNTREKLTTGAKDLVEDAKEDLNNKLDEVKESYNEILDKSAKKTITGVKSTKENLKA